MEGRGLQIPPAVTGVPRETAAGAFPLLRRVHRFLTDPVANKARRTISLWFTVSLACSTLFGLLALQEAFGSRYVVQDDARLHVFWMQRFLDPELFGQDLIADYFESTTPIGFIALYWLAARAGLDPLTFSKILPLILTLITTAYSFFICMRILPLPAAAFVATLLLNENLWVKDDIISATPRAFFYPLFVAFLYYLPRRSWLPCLAAIALQGLFYPHTTLMSVGILAAGLWHWEVGPLRLSTDRRDYLLCAAGLCVALLVLAPFAWRSSEFGPILSGSEARSLPEFGPDGRNRFFVEDPWTFWLLGDRTGVVPKRLSPPLIWAGFALPLVLLLPSKFPLARRVSTGVRPLPQIVFASFGLFLLAHALIFKLHFPSRYTQHSLRIVMALAAGVVLIVVGDAVLRWGRRVGGAWVQERRLAALGLMGLVATLLVMPPVFVRLSGGDFPRTNYSHGSLPWLYEFLAGRPKDTLIASLTAEADNLPAFSKRSVLVGSQYAIAFHAGYYRQIRQRGVDLLRGQYSEDLSETQEVIRKYGIDYWLISRNAFGAGSPSGWARQLRPEALEAAAFLERGGVPALAAVVPYCTVLEGAGLVLLDAECILGLMPG